MFNIALGLGIGVPIAIAVFTILEGLAQDKVDGIVARVLDHLDGGE